MRIQYVWPGAEHQLTVSWKKLQSLLSGESPPFTQNKPLQSVPQYTCRYAFQVGNGVPTQVLAVSVLPLPVTVYQRPKPGATSSQPGEVSGSGPAPTSEPDAVAGKLGRWVAKMHSLLSAASNATLTANGPVAPFDQLPIR